MLIPIENIVHIVGRGQIIVCNFPQIFLKYDKKLETMRFMDVHIGDKVKIEGEDFTIKGIESLTNSARIGIILDKEVNDQVKFVDFYML